MQHPCATFLVAIHQQLHPIPTSLQVDRILAACTHPRVTRALMSATLPAHVESLARTLLVDPVRITVGLRNSAAASVKQRLLFAGREAGKMLAVQQLLRQGAQPPVLVFVHS